MTWVNLELIIPSLDLPPNHRPVYQTRISDLSGPRNYSSQWWNKLSPLALFLRTGTDVLVWHSQSLGVRDTGTRVLSNCQPHTSLDGQQQFQLSQYNDFDLILEASSNSLKSSAFRWPSLLDFSQSPPPLLRKHTHSSHNTTSFDIKK